MARVKPTNSFLWTPRAVCVMGTYGARDKSFHGKTNCGRRINPRRAETDMCSGQKKADLPAARL